MAASDKTKTLRTCEECGGEYLGVPRERFCPECKRTRKASKTRAAEIRRANADKEQGKICRSWISTDPSYCRKCGRLLPTKDKHRKLCDVCRQPAKEKQVRRRLPEVADLALLQELIGDGWCVSERMILYVARHYHMPYGSYGGMKAWLDEMHRLPPKEYLRKKEPVRASNARPSEEKGGGANA